jgi:hypothetical protein
MAVTGSTNGERLRLLVNGYQVTQAIYVAVTLGVPDLIASGVRDADDLAARAGAHPRSLYRLLRALAGVGVLREAVGDGDRRSFELTELGDLLRSDGQGSLAGWAGFVGRPYHWDAWRDLLHTVRTGEEAFGASHDGESVWNWRARHPEESRVFDRAMNSIAAGVARRLAETYGFGRFSRLADIGGGDGTLLATVLARNPGLRGVLFDLAHVISGAAAMLERAGVSDRCELVAGSFFDAVPGGCDAYLLKSVLHDWDDVSSAQILQRVREVAEPGTVLLLVERMVADNDPSAIAVMSDLNMMVNTGGAERTVTEWRALAESGGFEMTGTVDIGLGWHVVETSMRA